MRSGVFGNIVAKIATFTTCTAGKSPPPTTPAGAILAGAAPAGVGATGGDHSGSTGPPTGHPRTEDGSPQPKPSFMMQRILEETKLRDWHETDGIEGRWRMSPEPGQGLQYELGILGKSEQKSYLRRVADKLKTMFAIPRGITIDSGAAEHVIPSKWINSTPVRPSPGSTRGVHDVAAIGARIPNLGEQRVGFWTSD